MNIATLTSAAANGGYSKYLGALSDATKSSSNAPITKRAMIIGEFSFALASAYTMAVAAIPTAVIVCRREDFLKNVFILAPHSVSLRLEFLTTNVIQILGETGSNISANMDLTDSTEELISEYKKVIDENSQYQTNQTTLQGQVQSLQSENDDLKSQIQILKGTLLNTYSSDEINSVIEQGGLKRDISKRLDNLECLDSVNCEQVPSVKDLYGTTHSISYRFEASDTAWAKFKLDGQYDTFAANIVTSEDTNRDANMSVEIYLDDVLVGRVDDVVRDEHIRPISVSVNGGNVLMIKVIRTNSRYDSHAYICDTTLSVLQ